MDFSSFISFSSAIISFINSCCNFNLDFFYLVVSVAISDVGSYVGILSKFFIGNNLLLKLLKIFPLALKSNPKLFKKKQFFNGFFTVT